MLPAYDHLREGAICHTSKTDGRPQRELDPMVTLGSEHPCREGRSGETRVLLQSEQTTGTCSGDHSIELLLENPRLF